MNETMMREKVHQAVDKHCEHLRTDDCLAQRVIEMSQDRPIKTWQWRSSLPLKLAIIMSVIFIVLFVGLLFPSERIVTTQSPDNEQYYAQGMEDPIGSTVQANAHTTQTQYGSYNVTDWEEVVSLFGYEPNVPTWLPDGWHIDNYQVDFFEPITHFCATYAHEGIDRRIVFNTVYYFDIESVYLELEQNEAGTYMTIGGMNVYITSNVNDAVAVWYDGHMECILTGPITTEALIQCIESIYSSE